MSILSIRTLILMIALFVTAFMSILFLLLVLGKGSQIHPKSKIQTFAWIVFIDIATLATLFWYLKQQSILH